MIVSPSSAFLIALGGLLMLASGGRAQEQKRTYAAEHIEKLKTTIPPKDYGSFGPGVEKCLKYEPDGLRLTLAAGHDGVRPTVGLGSRFGIKGDCEITLHYEILTEPAPTDAGAVTRFGLTIGLDKPYSGQDQASLGLRVTPKTGRHFYPRRMLKNEVMSEVADAKGKIGRLRLVRNGADVSYYVADGADQDFVLLKTFPFSPENLRSVSISGATGDAKAALDVRITELRIRADGLLMPPPPPVPVIAPPPDKAYAEELHQPLRAAAESVPGFEVIGPNKEQTVRLEATGMRITLPVGWGGDRPSTGLASQFGLKGDFELTMSFEILHEPEPPDAGPGGGARLNIGVVKDTPGGELTNINRTMGMKSGRIFYAWSTPLMSEKTGKKWNVHQPVPTEAMTGRLRLIRSGADVYYGASEKLDGDFKYFAKATFGAEDIRQIRIIAGTGGERAAYDVRVADLRIRADAIPGKPAAQAVAVDQPPEMPSAASRRPWLAIGVLVGLTAVLLTAIAVAGWVFLRK